MDWVKVCLYSSSSSSSSACLQEKLDDLIRKNSEGYIWESGELLFSPLPGSTVAGTTFYSKFPLGDNLDDEWFTVYLLLKITEEMDDVIVSVHDQDGEFILMEAADFIPDWLEPETSSNRVFIHRGKLHIIPIEAFPKNPSLKDAMNFIRKDPFASLANSNIQEVIRKKTRVFEGDLQALNHCAKVTVPVTVAAVFKEHPKLISRAIEALFDRSSKRVLTDATVLRPMSSPKVTTLVTLSKSQYAKLAFNRFNPPKDYLMVPTNDVNFVKYDLGLKLTAGLDKAMATPEIKQIIEMICSSIYMNSLERYLVDGEETDTKWLEIDSGQVMEEDFTFKMNENEVSSLLEQWDKEFDDPKTCKDEKFLRQSVDNLKGFIDKMSLYEGVDVEADDSYDECSDEDSAHFDSSDEDLDEDEEMETSEDFLEFEILETLKHDPDLLMRIVELSTGDGDEQKDLMSKLQEMISKMQETTSTAKEEARMPKKGIADIDPVKVSQARSRPDRKLADELERQNNERLENGESNDSEEISSDEDLAGHTPTLEEIYKTIPKKEVRIDEEEERFEEMQDYYDQMDAELSGKLKSADFTKSDCSTRAGIAAALDSADIELNLAKSLIDIKLAEEESGKQGPSHTVFASISKDSK